MVATRTLSLALSVTALLFSPLPGSAAEPRPLWTTSRIAGTPDPPPAYQLERVFPGVEFKEPVYLTAEPGSKRLVVVERSGKVYRLDRQANEPAAELWLETGIETYSLLFHPKFAENGVFFVFGNELKNGRGHTNRVLRCTLDQRAQRRPAVPRREVLLEYPSRGHNGGDMAFGPDGFLYLTAGDGETGVDDPDPGLTGQDPGDLRGGILRIDVDKRSGDLPYAIPADNPFLTTAGARPEVWAFGLRNPWRFSIDPVSGQMLIGDNGEETWESIYVGRRGANYGWSVLEGSHAFNLARPTGPGPFEPPIVEHPHSDFRSIVGGHIYRGARLPELRGTYVYGDFETGKIRGLLYDGQAAQNDRELADTGQKIIAFGLDQDRELYVLTFGGQIYRLAPNQAPQDNQFPRRLSQTGLFTSLNPLEPAVGVLPYEVNTPVWADGLRITRHLAVPGESQIEFHAELGWRFPAGGVAVQTLWLPGFVGGSHRFGETIRPIETRLLHFERGQWRGYSYLWNDDATDALLVRAAGRDIKFDRIDRPGAEPRVQHWRVASRAECMVCHSTGPRHLIGLTGRQLNRPAEDDPTGENQLARFARWGLFSNPPAALDKLPKLVDPHNTGEPLESRARAYLHANCAHCHMYSGAGNARLRLDAIKKPAAMGLFGVAPEHGAFGLDEARLVWPGHPERSVLYHRLAKLGRGRMPQLGSQETDLAGLDLIHRWIQTLPAEIVPSAAPLPADSPAQRQRDEQRRAALALLKEVDTPAAQRRASARQLLATPSGALLAHRAMDDAALPGAVADELVAIGSKATLSHIRDLFERYLPAEERSQLLGSEINPNSILQLTGDAAQGRKLFLTAPAMQCKACHGLEAGATRVGPDLSKLTKRTTRPELLESILDPSRTIDPEFRTLQIETKGGQLHAGLLIRRTPEQIILRTAQGKELPVSRAEMEAEQPSPTSLMPQHLLRDLTAQEAADLLEFLFQLNAK